VAKKQKSKKARKQTKRKVKIVKKIVKQKAITRKKVVRKNAPARREIEFEKEKRTPLGGMAFADGVMLRTRNNMAIAMVDDSGGLEVASFNLRNIRGKFSFLSMPFVRGIFFFIESIYFFLKVSLVKRPFIKKTLKQRPRHERLWVQLNQYLVYIIYLFLLIGFFDYLYVRLNSVVNLGGLFALYSFLFTFLYICLFIVLFVLVSIGRKADLDIFSYHGAEHKIIDAYEKNGKISLESLKKAKLTNDKCSIATFFWAVIILSFLVTFLKVSQAGWFLGLLTTLGLIFVSFSFAYELVRIAYSSGSRFLKAVFINPLYILQVFLTHEPDEKHLKVGMVAFEEVMRLEEGN